jgi:TRAP-type uncharacterized transport system substrate-binding protein
VFALLLAIVAATGAIVHFAFRPTELKIAVPATDALNQRVFGMASEMLRTARAPVRLEMVSVDSPKSAMEALERGTVNFAVARSDAAMQGRTHSVMIMRREVAVLIAPKTGKLKKVTDLPNVMLGITRDGSLDGSLLWPVLDYYGIPREKAKHVVVAADDVHTAFRQKKVDAIIAVGSVASKQLAEIVAEASRGITGALQFIDIEEADAIVKRVPALESVEVDQGAFGGRPPRPAESFTTLGFSVRLVTNTKVDTDSVAELMRQLYLIRQNIAAAVPGAGLMEAPDLDEATPFLIHPGVRMYVNGEQRTWFDRYNDYIYLALFLGTGLGSVAAGMFGLMAGKREDVPGIQRQKVQAALDTVRDATSAAEIDELEREADAIFGSVFAHGAKDELSAASIASFDMALTELRGRIAARRAALAG